MSPHSLRATTATLLTALAFASSAAADDCDKATRKAVLAELDHTSYTQLAPPPGPTHVELFVEDDVIYLETVYDADQGTAVLKGERFRYVKFKLEGIACRRMNGAMTGTFKEKVKGVLSEDRREIQFTFSPAGVTDFYTGEPAVTKVHLVRR